MYSSNLRKFLIKEYGSSSTRYIEKVPGIARWYLNGA
jgi:hypothetical protein